MPANGLQYAPPHPCVCYIDEKINGFNALAPAGPTTGPTASRRTPRLQKGSAYGWAGGPNAGEEDWPAFRHDGMRTGSVVTPIPAVLTLRWQRWIGKSLAAPVAVGDRLFVPLPDEHRIVALSASDGRFQWQYVADARIDSPPTYYRGALLFGAADGCVYCVRATDGRLLWRFCAAPEERLIAAFGQLESAWPVHGSILVMDGTAYFAAGRSSHLDGGLVLFGLDAFTGEIRCQNKLEGPHYNVDNISQNYQLPMGTLPDIMQGDRGVIQMREATFNARLQEQKPASGKRAEWVHAKAGLLDDSYFKRTPWSFGPKQHYARLIVHDERTGYFVRMFDSLRGLDPNVYFTAGGQGYLLFAVDKAAGKEVWSERIPVRVNAMVATKDVLFAAGVPDVIDADDPLAAFEGRKGAVLLVRDKRDGRRRGQYPLPAATVFNGMAAANGRLFVAMTDGRLTCFGR